MASDKQTSASEIDPEDNKKSQEKWRNFFSLANPDMWIAIGVVLLVIVLGWFFGNEIFHRIIEGKDWFRDELPYSLVVYYIFFCFCAVIFIPYGPFCIAIGFIYGVGWGFAIQMVAIFLSSAILFVVGRYVLKDKVHEMIAKTDGAQIWKGLMKYMGKDWKEAAKINILLCFMPVPYGSHPYLFSMTTIPFEQFVLFFMLGMIPNTILNLLIGQALSEAAAPDGINSYHIIGTGIAIVAIVLGVWYAGTIAQQVIDEAENDDPPTAAKPTDPLITKVVQ
mmetsp:Transcript_12892/g.25690  ORF Transcript_12892/g.25690 Transcript_12892/m.25690 type:complete len:279 (-) Transcript_12892:113-949(-)|eukprot:CAMPEP_0181315838 /NCGR_PEP_ID=MMETSP1101-20121128/15583_1 /TAXON_ID=46948 /ORGANISM="Rhodomonas abbreviata, Strain Caron Lab Isolate" /LENGTH=278 /DNA_ID=CAMNT_0023423061 /DNA_START=134 /DNA_END=970 /DNA_ORIENTATION=-